MRRLNAFEGFLLGLWVMAMVGALVGLLLWNSHCENLSQTIFGAFVHSTNGGSIYVCDGP